MLVPGPIEEPGTSMFDRFDQEQRGERPFASQSAPEPDISAHVHALLETHLV
jgi:hypothetical protein